MNYYNQTSSQIPSRGFNYSNTIQNSYAPSTGNYPLFPQPNGNVYLLTSAQEINNIPVMSNGISVGISLTDGVLFLKTAQNGNIVLNNYKITSMEQSNGATATDVSNYSDLVARIETLEKQLSAPSKIKEDKIEW